MSLHFSVHRRDDGASIRARGERNLAALATTMYDFTGVSDHGASRTGDGRAPGRSGTDRVGGRSNLVTERTRGIAS